MRYNYPKILLHWSVAFLFINILQAYFLPLIHDEAYYWEWSRNLDWGYFDHPPMVALWIKLGFSVFQNELGVRLISVLAGVIGFYILGVSLKPENNKQLLLYIILYWGMVLFQAFSFIATPDTPLLFFGILYLLALKRYLENQTNLNAILWGITMALLMYSKYHGILLIIFSILPLFKKISTDSKFYLAVLVGVICFAPHIYWQYANDFVSLEYHLARRNVNKSFKWSNSTDYLLIWIWASSPILFFLYAKAVWKFKSTSAFQKSLFGVMIGVFSFFLLITLKRYIQAQWILMGLLPVLWIVYTYYKEKYNVQKWILSLGILTMVLFAIARVYFVVQEVPFKTQYHGNKAFYIEAGKKTKSHAMFEKYQYTSLFNFYNYPHKRGENFVTIQNRLTHYELLKLQDSLEGKHVTYFSKYYHSAATTDTLTLYSRDSAVFYITPIENYHTGVFLDFEIIEKQWNQANEIEMKIKVTNQHHHTVSLAQNSPIKINMVFTPLPYAETVGCTAELIYEEFTLTPNTSIEIVAKGKTCDTNQKFPYFYLSAINHQLHPKQQSDLHEWKPN